MTAPTAGIAAKMTERTLQEMVRKMCRNLGIYHYHTHNSVRSEGGFPDSVIVGARGILWRELKSGHGTCTPAQTALGYKLLALGEDYAVWRPSDLLDGSIARQLAAIR